MTGPARKREQNRVEKGKRVRRATRVGGSMTSPNPARNGKPHGPLQKELSPGQKSDVRHISEGPMSLPPLKLGHYIEGPAEIEEEL